MCLYFITLYSCSCVEDKGLLFLYSFVFISSTSLPVIYYLLVAKEEEFEHHMAALEDFERPSWLQWDPFPAYDEDDDDVLVAIRRNVDNDNDENNSTNRDNDDGNVVAVGNRVRNRLRRVRMMERAHQLTDRRRGTRSLRRIDNNNNGNSYIHYKESFDIPKSDPGLENRRQWLKENFSVNDDKREEKRCIICKPMTKLIRRCTICRSCFEVVMMVEEEEEEDGVSLSRFRSSHKVWKLLMSMEQKTYTKNLGYTNENETKAVYISQNPVLVHHDTLRKMTSLTCNKGHGGITPEVLMLKRIKACIGWAVHGIVMEFIDGSTRAGYVSDVSSLYDDDHIRKRHGTEWVDISEGDYVVAVSGHNLSRQCFLCHTLRFEMASGRVIEFASPHEPWKGRIFKYNLPESALLKFVSFQNGRCIGVTATETRLHLPLRSPLQVHKHLPTYPHRDTFRTIQLCLQRYEKTRVVEIGEKPLGRDMWSKILYEYLKGSDLQCYEKSVIRQLKACQRLEQERNE